MEFEFGMQLQLAVADGIKWAKEGDKLIYVRKQSDYETSKSIGVTDEKGELHYIKEYRVSAPFGDEKAAKLCRANAPKLHVVLQNSCRNYVGENAVVGLDNAEKLAKENISEGEPLTIYELVPIKNVVKEPVFTQVE